MIKIVFTGPESTGKTTLTNAVAKHFNQEVVTEYARNYIDDLDRRYLQDDLLLIAKGQVALEELAWERKDALVICDTDLLTIKIWSEYKYGNCDPWILEALEQRKPDYYFLCGVDILWTFDPQREHPEEREVLLEIYKKEIEKLEVPYFVLNGNELERFEKTMNILDQLEIKL